MADPSTEPAVPQPETPQPQIKKKPRRRWWRWGLLAVIVAGAVMIGRPALHLGWIFWQDEDQLEPLPDGVIDDASRMNRTKVREIWPIPADAQDAERELAALLRRAAKEKVAVSIAGARHSMGGHTFTPDGLVIDMLPFDAMELDEQRGILRVGAGAKWEEIIPYLDEHGRSVAIMQSNHSFSVGGSISVNCHGWQFGRPPIASTVESFRLMKADGTIVRCSRDENAELFSLVLGGYGLFGVILDVELHVVPNERYRLEQHVVSVDEALETFDRIVADSSQENSDVAMVYARMSTTSDDFLREVIVNALYRDPAEDGAIPPLHEPGLVGLRRSLFRGSVGSDYGKKLRWQAETQLQPHLRGQYFARNQLLSEGVEIFQGRSPEQTDILHEYFVPRSGLGTFVEAMRRIIPEHEGDLLNVTVRSIGTDEDSFLRYADRDVFSFVMLFSQPRTAKGDAAMEAMTQDLIDAALAVGGRYYLPYRLHATTEQFHRAYPQAERFFELKRKYDPREIFQSRFYRKYGRPSGTVERTGETASGTGSKRKG